MSSPFLRLNYSQLSQRSCVPLETLCFAATITIRSKQPQHAWYVNFMTKSYQLDFIVLGMLITACFNIVLQFILDSLKYASMESTSKICFLTKTCCFNIVVLGILIIMCCQCVKWDKIRISTLCKTCQMLLTQVRGTSHIVGKLVRT